MINKIKRFFNPTQTDTMKKKSDNYLHYSGIILEKTENELIIGRQAMTMIKQRVLLSEQSLLPNMAYPVLVDENYEPLTIDDFSIRDRVTIEFDNMITENPLIPINDGNTHLVLINLDAKSKKK